MKKNILKPGKKNKIWYAEPNLGTYFGDEEITAIVNTLKNSKHYNFAPIVWQIFLTFFCQHDKKKLIRHLFFINNILIS